MDLEHMNTTTRRLLGGFAIAATLFIGQGGLTYAASPAPDSSAPSGPTGNEMLSVQPALISVSVAPGGSTTTQLTLRAAANLNVTISTDGLGQATDSSFKSLTAADDTSPYSARTMVTASQSSLRMKPGDKVQLTVSISVPQNAGEGSRYALLDITGMPAGASPSSNVGFGVQLGVSTIVQISGTNQNKTGQIKNIAVGKSLPGQALPITVSFVNTGNVHYGAIPNELVTTATLQDSTDALLANANLDGNKVSIIPTFDRDIPLTMTPASALISGQTYHLEVGVGLKDGTVLDQKAIDFTWTGAEILSQAPVPVTAAPVTAAPSTDPLPIILAAIFGGALVVVAFVVFSRVRKRGTPSDGAAGGAAGE
jgi:hypothetical protein